MLAVDFFHVDCAVTLRRRAVGLGQSIDQQPSELGAVADGQGRMGRSRRSTPRTGKPATWGRTAACRHVVQAGADAERNPIVVLLRRDWEFLFAQLRSTRAVVDYLWDSTTMQTIITLTGHTGRVRAVAWSPDGTRLATACEDGLIIFWSGEGTETTSIAMQTVYSLAWSKELITIGQVGRPTLARLSDGRDTEKSEPLL